MLEAMFSGRHNIRRNKKGQVFIDRDSTYFRHVLNFLRTGARHLPHLYLCDIAWSLCAVSRFCVVLRGKSEGVH